MKLYSVIWTHNGDLSKKGKCRDLVTGYTALCNTRSEALHCLEFHFKNHYSGSTSFDIEDGDIKISSCKVDSRGFFANYLLLDRMFEPLELSSIDQSLLRMSKRYHL